MINPKLSRKRFEQLVLILVVTIIVLLFIASRMGQPIAVDKRALVWKSWNVTISAIDTTNNTFHVEEIHQLAVINGVFNGGERRIPLDRMVALENIQVFDDNTQLMPFNADPDHCSEVAGVVCLAQVDGQEDIYYNFLKPAGDAENRVIRYEFDVSGALRSYPDGDQLWWKALADNRQFGIKSSTLTIRLPTNFAAKNVAMYATGDWTQDTEPAGNLIFHAFALIDGGNIEARVEYPHNPAMSLPPWQTVFDIEQLAGPFLSLLLFVLDGLALIGGLVFTLIKITRLYRGRSRLVIPSYLTEPPTTLSPAAAGALLSGRVEGIHIVATLIDLTRRGLILIEQETPSGIKQALNWRINRGRNLLLHNTAPQVTTGLTSHDHVLLSALFGMYRRAENKRLIDVAWYSTSRKMGHGIWSEVLQSGLIDPQAHARKRYWNSIGTTLIVLVALFWGVPLLINIPLPVWLLEIGIIPAWLGVMAIVIGYAIPIRTAKGVEVTAQWQAFRVYLKNIRQLKAVDADSIDIQFEHYIGYAVAFDLGKEWVNVCAKQLTTMPRWFYPTALYGVPYSTMASASSINGATAGTGGSLNMAAVNLTKSLNALNVGMVVMLNSAAFNMGGSMSVGTMWSGGGFIGGATGGGFAGFH